MSVDIDIEVDLGDAMRRLESMKLRATNFRPVFWYARAELEKANAANFTANGLPVGGWAPRDTGTIYGWPMLRKSGQLFSSLINLRGAPNDIGRTQAIFGTNVEYAKFHQMGTRHMPKRQIVYEPFGFATRLANVAADYVADGVVPD
jgi:phage gpG-like protein